MREDGLGSFIRCHAPPVSLEGVEVAAALVEFQVSTDVLIVLARIGRKAEQRRVRDVAELTRIKPFAREVAYDGSTQSR